MKKEGRPPVHQERGKREQKAIVSNGKREGVDIKKLDSLITRCASLRQVPYEEYAALPLHKKEEIEGDVIIAAKLLDDFIHELGFAHTERFCFSIALGADYYLYRGDYFPSVEYTLRAMRHMRTLERMRPGALQYLYNAQGIRNFARFSPEFWATQYDERERKDPYMVVVIPSDLEDKYMTDTGVYEELQGKLADLDTPHLLRMVEIHGLAELYRAFARLDKMYNHGAVRNSIKLALFDGHGLSQRLFLGDKHFGIQELETARFEKIFKRTFSESFSPNATFVLASCEAAGSAKKDERSVGVVLKQTFKRLVGDKIAVVATTDEATPFLELTPKLKKNGALRLSIESHSTDEAEGGTPYEKL